MHFMWINILKNATILSLNDNLHGVKDNKFQKTCKLIKRFMIKNLLNELCDKFYAKWRIIDIALELYDNYIISNIQEVKRLPWMIML